VLVDFIIWTRTENRHTPGANNRLKIDSINDKNAVYSTNTDWYNS